jgi:hypothetical protein
VEYEELQRIVVDLQHEVADLRARVAELTQSQPPQRMEAAGNASADEEGAGDEELAQALAALGESDGWGRLLAMFADGKPDWQSILDLLAKEKPQLGKVLHLLTAGDDSEKLVAGLMSLLPAKGQTAGRLRKIWPLIPYVLQVATAEGRDVEPDGAVGEEVEPDRLVYRRPVGTDLRRERTEWSDHGHLHTTTSGRQQWGGMGGKHLGKA